MINCEKMKPYVGLLLRIGLGVIFLYHGYHKVFGAEAHLGTSWNPHGMPIFMQVMVAWGEFLAGLGFLTGVLTWGAALGIILLMSGAIATVHGKNGFNMMNHGYEYNFALITMCLALIASGPGKFSLPLFQCKAKEQK